jgi:hypothetical protein
MIRKLWRSFVGSVKWVLWIISLALIANAMLFAALLVTPVMFFFFVRARSTAEVFETLIERIADKVADEMQKLGVNMYNDVEFDMEIDEDEDNLF